MSDERVFSMGNKWFLGSTCVVAFTLAFSLAMGFVILPYAQSTPRYAGIWDEICSAAGLPHQAKPAQAVMPDHKTSLVVLSSSSLQPAPPVSIGRGATLAQQCAICHGPTGVSHADSPNLAGQFAPVIYKQLKDFKTGARVNSVMSPLVASMGEQDMIDVAAYYAFLAAVPGNRADRPAPAIVASGAPMRGIAPCGSCHGGIESKAGSPWLEEQSPVYIKAQLQAFANGSRTNDINQQMRNVARGLTEQEMDEAAAFYGRKSQPD